MRIGLGVGYLKCNQVNSLMSWRADHCANLNQGNDLHHYNGYTLNMLQGIMLPNHATRIVLCSTPMDLRCVLSEVARPQV